MKLCRRLMTVLVFALPVVPVLAQAPSGGSAQPQQPIKQHTQGLPQSLNDSQAEGNDAARKQRTQGLPASLGDARPDSAYTPQKRQ